MEGISPMIQYIIFFYAVICFADANLGIQYYGQGDFAKAKIEFEKAIKNKDPMGTHYLASLYYQGYGVKKDLSKSVELFTESANLGVRESQANLGLMYQKGDGVEINMEKAIHYYEKAAKQGDLQSAFNLGQIYRKGTGVEIDMEISFFYYEYAAFRNHLPSMNELGLFYAQGIVVENDFIEAYAWKKRSRRQEAF